MQDLFEIGLHESLLDCDQVLGGGGIGGNPRTRRQNHNSRQKKYSSSVSSRQREGGSLPSNVNVTHQLSGGVGAGVGHDLAFMQQEGTSTAVASGKAGKKEKKLNLAKAVSVATSSETKEFSNTNNTLATTATASSPEDTTTIFDSPTKLTIENTTTKSDTTSSATAAAAAATAPAPADWTFAASGGDFIIDMDEPMMDIQQQQKILQSKGPDSAKQVSLIFVLFYLKRNSTIFFCIP